MQGQQGPRAVTPWPPLPRQPSGYSSASFYNYTSLSSSVVTTSDSDFECPSSSASTSSSGETSTPSTAPSSTSAAAASSPEQTPRLRGSPAEQALSFSSGPSPEVCGGAGSPAHCSGAEEGSGDGVHSDLGWASGPTVSPGSGFARPRQRRARQGSPSGSDTDLGAPLRRVAYSPRITLKDWRGECACWREKEGRASRRARPARS